MPKRKCSTKQLTHGKTNRQKKTCRRNKKRTGEEYDAAGNPIEPIPDDDYYEGVPEPRDPLGWQNAPDIPGQHKETPVVKIESKPLEQCTPKERKKEEKKINTFMKVKAALDNNPKLKNNEPTVKIVYNGIPIDIPVSMIPKDRDFISKYGDKIKNALIATGALGALAFGGKKVWDLANPFIVKPIVAVAETAKTAKGWYDQFKDWHRDKWRSAYKYVGVGDY